MLSETYVDVVDSNVVRPFGIVFHQAGDAGGLDRPLNVIGWVGEQ